MRTEEVLDTATLDIYNDDDAITQKGLLTLLLAADQLLQEVDGHGVMTAQVSADVDAEEVEALLLGAVLGLEAGS